MGSNALDRITQFVGCILILLLIVANQPRLLGQSPGYQPPGYQPGTPYLRAPGYSGPPLSTALPSSGPFSAGIQMPTTPATGVPLGTSGGGFYSQRSPFPNVVQNTATLPDNYLPVPMITGRSMAMYAVGRGITRGMRF